VCLATVYLDNGDQRQELMRDVAWIEPRGGSTLAISFLGERRAFAGKIKSVDLLHGTVVLEEVEEGAEASA